MKYVHFVYDTCYCGTREDEYIAFPDDTKEQFLDEWAIDRAEEHGNHYAYIAECESEDIFEDFMESYWESVYGDWSYCSKEEWEENNGYVYD